ncbi:LysR family transcriptional regulator [Streptomyces sp. NBRC 110028]|uniref:LysR family transcriptional regulator n=1 Tax=Streptomyces sp. NBRC 110028 TaxID=1621260 RepID=UPI0006E158AF|nr:LysR family transcriptional regulator [Streptomyces sp. NBRC 110028]
MDRLETRELEYFLTIAEELHFGRAAARLVIAQPALSKAIRRLERRLGVRLLERSSRRVSLTPAGEVLFREGRQALDMVLAAARRAQQAGNPDARLRLVVKPGGDGGLLPDILACYEQEPDAPAVEVLFGGVANRANLLRDGRADVALLHTPHENIDRLEARTLVIEQRVAVLPDWHRLAGRASVRLVDLQGETLPRWHGLTADGATGPEVADMTQLAQLVALGRTIAVLPQSFAESLGPDLLRVPVLDAVPSTLVVAWPPAAPARHVEAFVRVARTVAARRHHTNQTPANAEPS